MTATSSGPARAILCAVIVTMAHTYNGEGCLGGMGELNLFVRIASGVKSLWALQKEPRASHSHSFPWNIDLSVQTKPPKSIKTSQIFPKLNTELFFSGSL